MWQLKQTTDMQKDEEQKLKKRRRKFTGRQGYRMKMENVGFMLNHY